MLIIVFGLPGTGKTYIGKIIKKEFGFFFYDGDTDLTPEMKKALQKKITFTNIMRNMYFRKLLKTVTKLNKHHKNIVLAQTFIKEKYRLRFLKQFPDIKFILIQTNSALREMRLVQRIKLPLDKEYARRMCINFEEPHIEYEKINNDTDGEKSIIQQLKTIIVK